MGTTVVRCCQTRAWTGEAVAGLRGAHRDGHHFGKLRDAGLVTSSKLGIWAFYELSHRMPAIASAVLVDLG
jgi:hypothetical protein